MYFYKPQIRSALTHFVYIIFFSCQRVKNVTGYDPELTLSEKFNAGDFIHPADSTVFATMEGSCKLVIKYNVIIFL